MIYELRVYKCVPGRLPALLNRFATITLKIWEKHGIKQAGFWTTLVGESNMELYYLLQWDSLADREKKWNAFAADPEWHAKRAETEKDGAIMANVSNQFLSPTAFSAVKWGRSVGLEARFLREAGPFGEIVGDVGGELGRRAELWVGA